MMGNPEGGQHFKKAKKKDWGFTASGGECLSSSVGRMLKVVGFRSTMLSPSVTYSDDFSFVSWTF